MFACEGMNLINVPSSQLSLGLRYSSKFFIEEKKTSIFHLPISCLLQCLDSRNICEFSFARGLFSCLSVKPWEIRKHFQGVSKANDNNKDETMKSVLPRSSEDVSQMDHTKKAQHKIASWASVITRYQKNVWFVNCSLQTILFWKGRHLFEGVKITLGESLS